MDYKSHILDLMVMVVVMAHGTMACRCDINHPQKKWCESEFGILANIIKHDFIENTNTTTHTISTSAKNRYTIKIQKIFKKNAKFKKAKQNYLFTPVFGTGCGERLCPKKKYLLTGKIIQKELWINSCNWIQEYKTLTHAQKHGVKKLYNKNCDCQIRRCSRHGCDKVPKNVCPMITIIWSCYTQFGLCIKRKAGKHKGMCHWKNNLKFRKCLNKYYYSKKKKPPAKNKKRKH